VSDTAQDFELNPIERLSRDLREGAATLGDNEVRFLVDAYYIMQEDRKRSGAQERALEKNNEPHSIITWLFQQNKILEKQIQNALDVYTRHHMMGSWMRSIYGIGPVISAGLLAHIDMNRAPTVGHIWSFAGLMEGSVWLGSKEALKVVSALVGNEQLTPAELVPIAEGMGADPKWLSRRIYSIKSGGDKPFMHLPTSLDAVQYVDAVLGDIEFTRKDIVTAVSKRPWNEGLKTLCWKVGQSFMKFSNEDECYYGKLYRERKAFEVARNQSGVLADYAKNNAKHFKPTTEAYGYYTKGELPPAHVDARARRYVVKLFLSHLHEEWYRRFFHKEPPAPFALAMLHHGHYIPPPPNAK
jgi:hypothetical protein